MSSNDGPTLRDRSVLDALPEAVVVVDVRGDIVYLNRQAERVFGITSEGAQGEPVEILIAEEHHEHHREQRNDYVISPELTVIGPRADIHGRRRDGSTFPAEISVCPVSWAATTLYCAVVRDLSEARERESLLCSLLAATPEALVMVNQGGEIVAINARVTEFFGYSPDDLVGQPVEILLSEHMARTHANLRARYMESPHSRAIDATRGLLARRRDGTEFPVDISLTPVQTKDGHHVFATVRDVSDRVSAQEEADRRQQEFFATVSHELRTPLTSIIGYAELLLDSSELGGQAQRFLEVIVRNARRERRLVDDMLTLVAIQDSGLPIELSEIDLVLTVSNAVEGVRPQAVLHEVDLGLEVTQDPVRVTADRDRIEQAVENLLSNALKFTPPAGRIRVRVGAQDGLAHIEVADTGSGVPSTDIDQIFDRAFRSSAAVTRQLPGVGLGLTIARAIAEAHDGSLTLVATGDQGTTFRIELPLTRVR